MYEGNPRQHLAAGNSVGLMVLLMFGSVAYLPIVLPGVLSGVNVSVWQIARPLLALFFIAKGWLLKGGSVEPCSTLQTAAKGTR